MPMDTIRYEVTFRENKDEPPQRVQFGSRDAANALAIAVERNGGIALVVPVKVQSLIGARSL